MAHPVHIWRYNVVESSLPPLNPPGSSPVTGLSKPQSILDPPLAVISPQGMDVDDMLNVSCVLFCPDSNYLNSFLKGIHLPNSIPPANTIGIALVYSSEQDAVLGANVIIAERKYRQALIAARCYSL